MAVKKTQLASLQCAGCNKLRGDMDNQVYNQIVSFVWGIADDCLRDVYVRGKYRDVLLPMTVTRCLDAMLESTKPAVY